MEPIKDYKTIEVFGQEVVICDLSLEYVRKTQDDNAFDCVNNALKDACEYDGEISFKAGNLIYSEIIKHTFGTETAEDSGDAKK